MANATFTAVSSSANTTNFRLWGGGLSGAITTAGFIKTADTGQVDWATVTATLTWISTE